MSETAEKILDALRRCKTVAEVNDTARHFAGAVEAMSADPDLRVRVIHIRNLAAHKRALLLKDGKD